uniref:Uncharacterized protein n=1 Tax=Cacopsylla melanoneura TaxID=428564 RepID=A0A8D9E780_9HEMI
MNKSTLSIKSPKSTGGPQIKTPESFALNVPMPKTRADEDNAADEEFDALADDAFLDKLEAHKIGDLPRKTTSRDPQVDFVNNNIRPVNDRRTSVVGRSGEKPSPKKKIQGKEVGWKGPKVTFDPNIDVRIDKPKEEPNVEPVKPTTHQQAKEDEVDDDHFPGILLFSGGFNDGFSIVAKRKAGSPIRIAISGENHEGKRSDRNMCVVQLGGQPSSKLPGTGGGSKHVSKNMGVWKGSMYNEADCVLPDSKEKPS